MLESPAVDCTLPEAHDDAPRARQIDVPAAPRARRRPRRAACAAGPALAYPGRMRRRLAALLLLVAAAMGPAAAARAGGRPAAEGDTCRKLAPGKRLKLNLKPNTDLVDLVSWISAITCKQFIVP